MMDSQGTGKLGLTYLAPKGWITNDRIDWNFQRRLAPMICYLDCKSSDSAMEVFYTNSYGSRYSRNFDGSMTGQAPPEKPSDILIGQFQRTHPGIRFDVVSQEDKPVKSIFPEMASTGAQSVGFNSSVKLRFDHNGVPSLFKAQLRFDGSQSASMGLNGSSSYNGIWLIQDGMSVVGPESKFPEAMRIAGVVFSSRRLDPHFFQAYADAAEAIIKQGAQETADYVSSIRQKMAESYQSGLREDRQRDFKQQMAAKDQHSRDFCDYLLDRERYTDGQTEFILPSGYNRAISNGAGTYVVTNDASYKPTGEWHELGKVN
ncbi:MAG TPA: hypothetical protein VG944_12755 [Fimbriimonas sp.]|nr:hypothetical protein [Fimbriimonas sp.]